MSCGPSYYSHVCHYDHISDSQMVSLPDYGMLMRLRLRFEIVVSLARQSGILFDLCDFLVIIENRRLKSMSLIPEEVTPERRGLFALDDICPALVFVLHYCIGCIRTAAEPPGIALGASKFSGPRFLPCIHIPSCIPFLSYSSSCHRIWSSIHILNSSKEYPCLMKHSYNSH